MYSELYTPVKKMLAGEQQNQCQYKEKVLWAYLKALEQTAVWPSERVSHKLSIDSILSALRRFEYTDPHPGGTKTCFTCKGNFKKDVQAAIERTRAYFDGLCLGKYSLPISYCNFADVYVADCMNSAKTGDKDKDYWKYLSATQKMKFARGFSGRWDEGCRVRHDEPTWYFSFMGSRKTFDEWRFARGE